MAGSWLILVWILVDMLQGYFPSGERKIIHACSAGYHYNLTAKWHRRRVGFEWRRSGRVRYSHMRGGRGRRNVREV